MCLRAWAPEVQGVLLGTETGVPETPRATPSDAEPSATPTLSGAHTARPGLRLSPLHPTQPEHSWSQQVIVPRLQMRKLRPETLPGECEQHS